MSHRLAVITNAIQTAFIDHPTSGPGMTWDQIIKSDEEPCTWHGRYCLVLKKLVTSSQKLRTTTIPSGQGEKRSCVPCAIYRPNA